jgi:hypothetical protein
MLSHGLHTQPCGEMSSVSGRTVTLRHRLRCLLLLALACSAAGAVSTVVSTQPELNAALENAAVTNVELGKSLTVNLSSWRPVLVRQRSVVVSGGSSTVLRFPGAYSALVRAAGTLAPHPRAP